MGKGLLNNRRFAGLRGNFQYGKPSTGGGSAPATFDYIITNDAGWASIPAPLLANGGRIGVEPGTYTAKTITATPSARLTFAGTNPSNKPVIDRMVLGNCSNITLEDLSPRCSAWANNDQTAAGLLVSGTVNGLIARRLDIRGNYRGSYADVDVVNTLPEYACIAADVTGDAITSLEITSAFVGDLMADGTYNLDFSPAGGTGAAATFTVSGGNIVSTNLTAGGSGYNQNSHRTRRAIWAGQRRLLDWMPWGVRGISGGNLVGAIFEDCSIKNVTNAIKPATATGGITIIGCDFERVYMDYMSFGITHPTAPFPVTIMFNTGRLPFSVSQKDAGDPHSDWVQFYADDIGTTGQITTQDWDNINIIGNIFQDGTCRGAIQGMIIADMPSGVSYAGTKIVGNHIASKTMGIGITLVNPKDAYVYGNSIIRHDHTDAVNNTGIVKITVPGVQDNPGGGYYAYGRSLVGNNISELIETTGWGPPEISVSRFPNTNLGLRGATNAYTAVFANPSAARDTVAEITAAYTPIGAHVGRGAFGISSIINHSTRTYTPSNEPSYIEFSDLTGQSLSTLVTSEWSRVLGGVNGRAITISGGEYSIASDAAGTGATAFTSSAGTVNPGQFVRIRRTTSASNGATSSVTLTIGTETFDWSVTTIATPYVAVDNGGTARSVVSPVSSETGIRKLVVAFRAKPDSLATGANWIADSTAGSFRIYSATTTSLRGIFVASTRVNLRPTVTITTTAKTHIITADFTNTVASQGCYWATLEDGVVMNNGPGTGGNFDTRSVVGSGTDYGAFSMNASGTGGLFSSLNNLGIFGESDGGGVLLDGQMEFVWVDWGDANYVIPDISQSSVRSKWTSDQIGANGQGPTGAVPKLFYSGTATQWNDAGGLINKGSLTAPLIKQTGTYI